MNNLLPCPFCGGEAIIKNISDTSRPDKDDWWVSCRGCQIERPSAKPNEIVHSRDEAIAAWNRRAPAIPPDVREAIRKLADYGMPLGATNHDWKRWRDIALTWLDAQEDNHE